MTTEATGLTNEHLLEMYRDLLRVRRFEEKASEEFAKGSFPAFLHLSIGQEAVAVGTIFGLRQDDFVSLTHRCHGGVLMKGVSMHQAYAELIGRKTGCCGGKGGFHMGDMSKGLFLINGILGSGTPIAVGSALAMKKAGTDQVHLAYFGDGQANLGAVHEGMNFAAVFKLPVVFVCENNNFAISLRQTDAMAIEDIADRAAAYGFPGVVVDGNDVIAVYEVTQEAVRRARRGDGPTLIELKTCRWHGHFEGDPEPYRSREEAEECKKRDPVKRLRERLMSMGVLTDELLDKIAIEVDNQVNEAWQQAWQDPMPEPADALVLGH